MPGPKRVHSLASLPRSPQQRFILEDIDPFGTQVEDAKKALAEESEFKQDILANPLGSLSPLIPLSVKSPWFQLIKNQVLLRLTGCISVDTLNVLPCGQTCAIMYVNHAVLHRVDFCCCFCCCYTVPVYIHISNKEIGSHGYIQLAGIGQSFFKQTVPKKVAEECAAYQQAFVLWTQH